MLIADTNEFHPLTDGPAYAGGHASDGSPFVAVIVRATYSNSHVDNAYASSVAQARAGKLFLGHYGYMTAGADAAAQGTFFGQTVLAHGGLQSGDSVWCDAEEGEGDQAPRIQAFLDAAHAVLHDNPKDEGVYSGAAFYAAHIAHRVTEDGVATHLWIAAYGQSAAPADGEELWQYTDAATVFPGVSGAVDGSIFNGTAADFHNLFSTPAPAPSPAPASVNPAYPVNHPPVAIMACSTGGYWVVGTDGGVVTFGGAPFKGSLGAVKLARPIVAGAATPDGNGYWLLGGDGGIFAFGSARYSGRENFSG